MKNRDRLLDLAAAVADGEAPDWSREAGRSGDPGEQRVVRELELLAAVLTSHQSLPQGGPRAREAVTGLARWGALEVLDEVGRGAYGTVYRARDTRLDRIVALKLRLAEADDAEALIAEGRMLAKVRHPHVVTVYGADCHDGRVGLWMELIQGATLASLLAERGSFGVSETVSVGLDLCGALAAVHGAGLVHGDVKAQNVLRESGGRLVLMDFSSGRDRTPRWRAGGGTITGTPLFMAPEVLAGGAPTGRSDIYALGVLLYHLLTRRYPFQAPSLSELAAAHARGRARSLRDARPDVPLALAEVVDRALARNPADRYASAGDVEQALLAAQRRAPARPGPRWRLPLAAAAAAVVILAVAGLWLGRRHPVVAPGSAQASGSDVGLPLSASVESTLWRAGVSADQPLTTGERVQPGDRMFLEVKNAVPIHVYVINLDREGHGYVLFPIPGAQVGNPLPPGASHRLPGDTTWEYDSWEVSSAGGRETFLVVASRRPLERLESALALLRPATAEGPQELGESLSESLRGVGILSRTGTPDGASRGAAAVSAALRALTSSPLSRQDLFVQEIVLENP